MPQHPGRLLQPQQPPQQQPSLIDRMKAGLKKAFGGIANRQTQLEGLEERSTNPTEAEQVVVRPRKRVKKRPVVVSQ